MITTVNDRTKHSTISNEGITTLEQDHQHWVPLWSLTFEKVQRGRVSSLSRRDYDSSGKEAMMLDDSGDEDYADYLLHWLTKEKLPI